MVFRVISFIYVLFFLLLLLNTSHANYIPLSDLKVLNKARELLNNKDYKSATNLLYSHINKSKKVHYMVYFYLGNCYLLQKNIDKAITEYKKCIEIKKDFPDAWINLAKCYYLKKYYSDAGNSFLKVYKLCNKKDNECAKYLYNAGICFYYSGKNKIAEDIIKQLIDKSGKNAKLEWIETISHILISQGKYKEALKYVVKLSEMSNFKNIKQWQEIRLEIYIKLNMKKQALSYLKYLLKQNPLDKRWWIGLAHFYLKENKYKEALVALIIKGFIEPHTQEEQKIIAGLYMSLDIPREAVKFYKELWEKKKDITLAKTLAQLFYRMYDYEKCLEWINRAIQIKKDGNLLFLKGQILYSKKMYKQAFDSFLASAKLLKNPGKAYLYAGYSAYAAGDLKLAQKTLLLANHYKTFKKEANRLINYLKSRSHLNPR